MLADRIRPPAPTRAKVIHKEDGMAEPKARTIQERFGFLDPELKSPKHDEMMLWLDQNAMHVLHSVFPSWSKMVKYVKGRQLEQMIEEATRGLPSYTKEEIMRLPIPPTPDDWNTLEYWIQEKIWEKPILDRSFTIGFIDLAITIGLTYWELRLTEPYNWNRRSWHWYKTTWKESFYFEVKPSIPSLGELIRQIRMYQSYAQEAIFVVVSPDDRFKETLAHQGIAFVKYTGTNGL
jgi:hypothetical protein